MLNNYTADPGDTITQDGVNYTSRDGCARANIDESDTFTVPVSPDGASEQVDLFILVKHNGRYSEVLRKDDILVSAL